MRIQPPSSLHHARLLGVTMLWLLGGSSLLLSTLVPLHTAMLGWTPAFWLLGAPLIMLLALEPTLPRQLLAQRRTRRRSRRDPIWH
ncbi:MAG: hypothetical protein EPN74_10110 [Rhodanobacter sp.]|nr:MAG: hypothetical protein EPN74_10110 [Rhodanobacter sp.]